MGISSLEKSVLGWDGGGEKAGLQTEDSEQQETKSAYASKIPLLYNYLYYFKKGGD